MSVKIKPATKHTNRPYVLSAYDNNWPVKFNNTAKLLMSIFGDDLVSIEHVGSTSVPSMWAKPQIDILITVKDLDEVKKLYKAMAKSGFKAHGDWANEGEEYFTLDNSQGIREVSVHVLPKGHRLAIDLIDVRDYLRSHPMEAKRYSDVKRKVNQEYPGNYTNYYDAKLKTIQDIRNRAARWRDH